MRRVRPVDKPLFGRPLTVRLELVTFLSLTAVRHGKLRPPPDSLTQPPAGYILALACRRCNPTTRFALQDFCGQPQPFRDLVCELKRFLGTPSLFIAEESPEKLALMRKAWDMGKCPLTIMRSSPHAVSRRTPLSFVGKSDFCCEIFASCPGCA